MSCAELIDLGFEARRAGRPAEALRLFSEAVASSREPRQRREHIRALKGLGQIQRDEGDLESALVAYEEATRLCRDEGDELLLAHTVRHVGDIQMDAGRLDSARACIEEALEIYRRKDNRRPGDFANALRSAAILREMLGEASESRTTWEEARAMYAELEMSAAVAECDAHIAGLGSDRG
jgi:tetratricopeptide (TPR) repeat protein